MSNEENKRENAATDNSGDSQTKKMKYTEYSLDDWNKRWTDNRIGFHDGVVNPNLEKHFEKMLNGRETITVFLPMCGKTVDIKWLYDKGHTVIGVEFASKPIKDFFDEQGLAYIKEDVKEFNGTLYKSTDGRIKLYNCDFFEFKKNEDVEIDGIFDRAAFVAINRDVRNKYADKIKSLMSAGTQYMLVTMDYDETIHPGPPHFVAEEVIEELYGKECNIKQIDYKDIFQTKPSYASWGLTTMNERVHLINQKESAK
ncbi:hypothetical protein SNE40_012091 [Patella caerulea]|uniref:thiopurine S-methyltransferase n=1 Tax=Patella caerulea TaxID=87958 RepID=A0AAN8PZ66_PATCE